jgi:hypothetical protein
MGCVPTAHPAPTRRQQAKARVVSVQQGTSDNRVVSQRCRGVHLMCVGRVSAAVWCGVCDTSSVLSCVSSDHVGVIAVHPYATFFDRFYCPHNGQSTQGTCCVQSAWNADRKCFAGVTGASVGSLCCDATVSIIMICVAAGMRSNAGIFASTCGRW